MTMRAPASPNAFLRMMLVDRLEGVGRAVADGDAFALGQARGLDHDRLVPRADEFLGRVGIGEAARLGGRDGLLAHQFLGEPFVGFDAARRPCVGPKTLKPPRGAGDRPVPRRAGLPGR